ncbi:hypothetical protein LV779_07560 [Streptomyces thinghirensis]|nr:hypothetical protein [Streptomyces thinghirensis]
MGRRDTASVYDVVRSAQGRIRHFRRVEIPSQVDFGITQPRRRTRRPGLAELFDNATRYFQAWTPPSRSTSGPCPEGICVVVDDAW